LNKDQISLGGQITVLKITNSEGRFKYHIFVFTVFSVVLFVFSPVSFMSELLAGVICTAVFLHIKEIKFAYHQWYEIAVFILLNAYLTLAIFGCDLFFTNSLNQGRLLNFLYFGYGFIWTAYVLQSFLDVLKIRIKINTNSGSNTNEDYQKKWLILYVIMIATFMLWQRAYNPVTMTQDSWEYISGWRNNEYLVSRSPVYAFLITIICRIAPTKPEVEWVAIAQILTSSAILATVLMYFKKWSRFRYLVLAAVIIPLIPSLGLTSIIIWRDGSYTMVLLWLTYVLVRIIDEVIIHKTADQKQLFSFCTQLCISAVLLYHITQTGMFVYLIIAPTFALLFGLKKQWKLLASIVLSAAIALMIYFPGFAALHVIDNYETGWQGLEGGFSTVKYQGSMHDIRAAYYDGGKFSKNTLAALKRFIPDIDNPTAKDSFIPNWVNTHLGFGEMTFGQFVLIYFDSFIHNPLKISRSMLFRVLPLWVIGPKGRSNWINYRNIWAPSTDQYSTQAPEIGVYRKQNFLTGVMDKYLNFMSRPVPATFVWRFGVWTALILISVMALILQKHYIWLLAYMPVLSFVAAICIANLGPDYRLFLPVLPVGMFLPTVLFFFQKNSIDKK
jgi:hypothetical protein